MDIDRYWKTVFETLQDGVMIVDPAGIITEVNSAAERLTGYSAKDLVGSSCQMLNCTGCEIIGSGIGADWCTLFKKGGVKAKKCIITNRAQHHVHVIKRASVLRDEHGEIIGAVETLRDMSEIVRQQEEIESLRKSCQLDQGFHGILGESALVQRLFGLIESVAQSEAPVMILGESGTGKELVARAIHEAGPRKDKPFVKVNCAALNENLLESELFGHTKGAYTGADRMRIGRFEAAHEGTIFLDEVGDVPLATQVKLLRVLEEKVIERVGDNRPLPVDVRIISATNKDLEAMTTEGQFRKDFYFRINVFPITCPRLADRAEDIPLIVQNFIEKNISQSGKEIDGLTPQALETLMAYHWPGNVRELRNTVDYAFVLCPGGWIDTPHLPPKLTDLPLSRTSNATPDAMFAEERRKMVDILRQAGGNQSKAANLLGVSRVTVWKRIKKYGIDLKKDLAP